jgi:hypothetical protein
MGEGQAGGPRFKSGKDLASYLKTQGPGCLGQAKHDLDSYSIRKWIQRISAFSGVLQVPGLFLIIQYFSLCALRPLW